MSTDPAHPIDLHVDRSRVYRALAQIFAAPDAFRFRTLQDRDLREFCDALSHLGVGAEVLDCAHDLERIVRDMSFVDFETIYYTTLDVSGKAYCPPTETTHTSDSPGHGLTRNVELADIAGFYRAFGVDLNEQTERVDCIAAELEFLQLVAAKQAIALEAQLVQGDASAAEQVAICRDASIAFLKDHLTRWAGRFATALEAAGAASILVTASKLARDFAQFDLIWLERE